LRVKSQTVRKNQAGLGYSFDDELTNVWVW